MSTTQEGKSSHTRDGEKIEGVYQGAGFCYVDVEGKRYGRASWIRRLMDGTGPSGTVRPIIQKFAAAVKAERRA